MAKSTTFENDFLKLTFNGTPIAGLADNTATAPVVTFYVALHTADPSVTAGAGTLGTQNASEVVYTGYSRVGIARTAAALPVTGNSVSPAAAINFGAPTAGANQTANFWSIGVASTGATKILYSGPLAPAIAIAAGAQAPQMTPASAVTES